MNAKAKMVIRAARKAGVDQAVTGVEELLDQTIRASLTVIHVINKPEARTHARAAVSMLRGAQSELSAAQRIENNPSKTAKASFYSLPADAKAVVSMISALAAKGRGKPGGVPSVYNQAEIAKVVRNIDAMLKVLVRERVTPSQSQAHALLIYAERQIALIHNFFFKDDIAASGAADLLQKVADRIQQLPTLMTAVVNRQ